MTKIKEERNETFARIRKFKDGLYYHSSQTTHDINFLLNEVDALTERCESLQRNQAVTDNSWRRLVEENAALRKHAERLSFVLGELAPSSPALEAYQHFRDVGVGKPCNHSFSECGQCQFCGALNMEKP